MMPQPDSHESAGVLFPPPLIYVAGLALGATIGHFVPLRFIADPYRWPLGVSLLLVWLMMWIAALPQFRTARTPISTRRPVTALITTGIYHYTRNPIYVGMTAFYLGAAIIAGLGWSLVLAIPVALVVEFGVVKREEAYLEWRFGEQYRAYKRSVHRWL